MSISPPSDPDVPLRERLRAALPAAMKARDRVAVAALRSALAAIDNAEAVAAPVGQGLAIEQTPVGVGAAEAARRALTASQVEDIVRAEVAEREAAARDYDRAGRPDHAERLRAEAAVLSVHLDIEVPLVGDGVTQGIVRVGDTVRRPVRPFTASVHAYLAHLHARGFTGAPLPLGYDERGREVLTYVAGDVPREPLPDRATTLPVLEELAHLVRRLHDAAEGFVPPADAVWGGRPIPEPELVSHMDYCPGNVIFRAGRPVALIDFDLARPTTRLADAVNALYWWAPLLHPLDRAPALVDADIPARVAAFADAYGMTAQQRAELVPYAVRRARDSHAGARAAAEADPVFRRFWDDGVKDRMPRAEAWWAENAAAVAAALGN